MTEILICPKTGKKLNLSEDAKFYQTDDGVIKYPIEEGVIRFLDKNDDFYEGAYMAKVKWMPKSEKWFHIWPLWIISNNYLWTVRKHIKRDSIVLELGSGGGIEYFSQRYNLIGLDFSFKSLALCPKLYYKKLQADAANIPLNDGSVDAIISACFWEHITEENKIKMLKEFYRVLKKDGILLFLYDVCTENMIINWIKKKDPILYKKAFLESDNHQGYLSPSENIRIFQEQEFLLGKVIGIEKTIFQTASVYGKARSLKGLFGLINKLVYKIITIKILLHIYNTLVIIIDKTFGKLISLEKSRMIISLLSKK